MSNDTISTARENAQQALESLKNQMEIYDDSISYNRYVPYAEIDVDPTNYSTEDQYLAQCALEISSHNGISVGDGDSWCVIDDRHGVGQPWGGYGSSYKERGETVTTNDGQIGICRAFEVASAAFGLYTSGADHPYTTRSLIIHETGHNFGAVHSCGGYQYNKNGQMGNVSPMATSYVKFENGESASSEVNQYGRSTNSTYSEQTDTYFAGTGLIPYKFCNIPNYEFESYCGSTNDWCRHTLETTGGNCFYSTDTIRAKYSTKEYIKQGAPLPI